MIITRTPYRVSFLGGASDYPCYFNKHGGCILGSTINKYCWLMVRPTSKFGPKYKITYSKVEECDSLEDIKHPAVRECLRFFDIEGVEVYHTSDLPARSGMGSSSAFVVGLLKALHRLKYGNLKFSNEELAKSAIFVERERLKEVVGCQDQYLTSYGGFNRIDFSSDKDPWVYRFGSSSGLFSSVLELNKYLMLFYTGVQRIASDIASSYVGNMLEKSSIIERLKTMTGEAAKALLLSKFDDFGRLLDESWELKKSLSENISTLRIDNIYFDAKDAGAIGGKLLGAGGGGFMLFYVPKDKQASVRSALNNLVEVPFEFESEGSSIIYKRFLDAA